MRQHFAYRSKCLLRRLKVSYNITVTTNLSEYQEIDGIEKPNIPETNLREKIDIFIDVVENSDLSESEKEFFLIDDSGIAVFLGVKPVFLADATTWDINLQIDPAIKIIENYKKRFPENTITQDLVENIIVLPGIGYFHVRETKNIIKVYKNYFWFSESEIDEMTPEQLTKFVKDGVKSQTDEIKRAILLGYPAGSGKNFDTRIDAIRKINKYFWEKGRSGAEEDGWNNHDIDIVDNAYTQRGGKKYTYKESLECLKKYQEKIGLTDHEAQAYSSTAGFQAFGYSFWNIPYPQNEFTALDNSRLELIKQLQPQLIKMVEYFQKNQHTNDSQIRAIPISSATSAWYSQEFDDIPG